MKKTQNVREGTRKNASRRRKELALALCVSLWMAGGSVAGAVEMIYIDCDNGNVLTISGGNPPGTVTPSQGTTTTAFTITGGEDWGNNWRIYGGGSSTSVSGMSLTINGGTQGFALSTMIVGGAANNGGNATGNKIFLQGGERGKSVIIANDVYGGVCNSGDGDATDNHVFLQGGVTVTRNIYGGRGTGNFVTGNTLHLSGIEANPTNTVGGYAKNFDTVSIESAVWGTPVLKLTGTGIQQNEDNTSWATIDASDITFSGVDALKQGQKTILIQNTMDTFGGTITPTGKYKIGTTLEGTGTASVADGDADGDADDLIYTIDTDSKGTGGGPTAREQTHNTVMGAEVGMAALSVGNDFVGAATEGLSLASNIGADGVSSFAQMGGGSMRQETGSHIDSHTWNAIIALGHANKKARGTFEYGAFFEYGSGNYTTFAEGGLRGDGSARYTGGGLLAKYTMKSSVYVEGSLRAGSIHDDARNVLRDGLGNPYSYETNAPYMGFHLGVGKEIPLSDGNAVDVYGKYFYNRKNGVSFDAGGHYDLDAVTSSVLRLGARYIVKRDRWNFYAGAAYEHELDGKATGTADGFAIRGADTSGGSFRGEIGATMTPGENSPWKLDLSVTGFAGKKQGFTGGVSVAFMF